MDLIRQNEALIRQYFTEVWNQGNLAWLDQFISPQYLNHASSLPNPVPGPEGLKPIVLAMRTAFPDLHYDILDLIIAPDRVAARVRMQGTHTGDFFGIAPTQQRVQVEQINIEHIRNGKIAEHWRITDELSLMKQLGIWNA